MRSLWRFFIRWRKPREAPRPAFADSFQLMAWYMRTSARILESANVPTRAIKERVNKLSGLMQRVLSNVEQFQPETAEQKKYAGAALQAIAEAKKVMEAIQNLAVIDED